MEVEDRLTQRIGLVSGKRWACTVKVPTCYAALTLMLKDLTYQPVQCTAKRCLKKFAVSRAVEFPDANFESEKSLIKKITKKAIDNAQRGEHLSEDDVEKILGSGWIPTSYALVSTVQISLYVSNRHIHGHPRLFCLLRIHFRRRIPSHSAAFAMDTQGFSCTCSMVSTFNF
jgi:hypothetical protein